MFIHNLDPVLFHLGPLEIRYYGLFFALGFIIAYFLLNYLVKKNEINLKKEDIADFLFYIAIGSIVGARLFYVVFYNFNFYLTNLTKIFYVWEGGLSFHGGLIGAIITGYFFCKKKNIDFYIMADITVIPLAFGLFLGRIGNFINGELVGRITNVPWCVQFKDFEGCRHPSQLYESAKNLFIFFFLFFINNKYHKKLKRGTLFWSFVILYSVLRFLIEFFRAPDEQLGFIIMGLTMGQLLNIVMFMVGVIFLYKILKK